MPTTLNMPSTASMPAVDGETFRKVMRRPASTVTLIASRWEEDQAGITATAVCSLSDSPPSILVCINKNSYILDVIRKSNAFSVNFLLSEQSDVAEIFAGKTHLKGKERFLEEQWTTSQMGLPVLTNCLFSLDCTVDTISYKYSHSIIVGDIKIIHQNDRSSPLMYADGSFKSLSA